MCEAYIDSIVIAKLYTRKEFIMMDSSIIYFCQYFYIPTIQKLSFHLPHVRMIGTHQCIKKHRETSKRRSDFQDVLCRFDYAERVVSIFAHQIKYEYYGGNIYVAI